MCLTKNRKMDSFTNPKTKAPKDKNTVTEWIICRMRSHDAQQIYLNICTHERAQNEIFKNI